ncbi:prepilin-type N-terminal cleavage/methylation domain-containing protein [Yersinia enterocolitica]|nr:prepilin-type N-terminal cleavage/methylation domain-containing protein [Yersinia enterocolitica]ELZ9066471.1 prepilin-type N-terminal cleavage/methylation domain-containing protein [Yersinia enterocolitica]MBW5811330.1 prepilin-type N-terminal cleavage/methylation domain-containing protein [Yersinia kristensenii]
MTNQRGFTLIELMVIRYVNI